VLRLSLELKIDASQDFLLEPRFLSVGREEDVDDYAILPTPEMGQFWRTAPSGRYSNRIPLIFQNLSLSRSSFWIDITSRGISSTSKFFGPPNGPLRPPWNCAGCSNAASGRRVTPVILMWFDQR